MNERIKDLIPNPFAVDYRYKDGPLDLFTEKEMLKYGESIVRECIKIVEPCKCGCCYGEPEGIIAEVTIKQIKNHFGVE